MEGIREAMGEQGGGGAGYLCHPRDVRKADLMPVANERRAVIDSRADKPTNKCCNSCTCVQETQTVRLEAVQDRRDAGSRVAKFKQRRVLDGRTLKQRMVRTLVSQMSRCHAAESTTYSKG